MAEAPETNEGTEPAAEAPSRKGGSKILPALLVLNSLMLAGVLAVLLLHPSGGVKPAGSAKDEGHEAGAKAGAKAPLVGPTQRLADFIVHLRDTDSDRYARVSFEIEVGSEADKERLGAALPRVRDQFIAYLSDRTFDELRGSEGLGHAKEELLKQLEKTVPEVPVKGLYITDIVVQ
ncbi:MAG TPA: flagellar basal body-associated FliL family protein [Anaeromyxobacteraceae bacterium]|nr:flagellar basal body-associated FliL family protein [Anaeromyxobacteraceae bacterium]